MSRIDKSTNGLEKKGRLGSEMVNTPFKQIKLQEGLSWDKIQDDNFTAADEKLLCLSSAKILHRADNLGKGVPIESICRLRVPKSILYEIDGDIRVDGNSSSIFWINSRGNESFKVKPFPRNCDPIAMNHVREFSVKSLPHQNESVPQCTTNHSYPAVIFATAGYTGNFFHEFTDILIPLFLTAHRYNGEVQFFITNTKPFVLKKYELFLKSLTRYKIIDIDQEGHGNIHCYKSMTVGLYAHREFAIDPLMPPLGYTFADFTNFMRKSYFLERHALTKHKRSTPKKPRLLLISRRGTRKLLKVNETATMASDLGFEIIIMEGGEELDKMASIVNSCDVMVGVHGAALSHMVFLPQNAVVVQIIPWGRLEGLCWCDYAFTVPKAKLKYLEYQVSLEESTILNKYPRDHPYIQDPFSVHVKGWFRLKDVYMNQDLILDLQRFRGTLVEALEHVKKYQ
ncbi:EGF domain-specific O-linked [Carex littledalei]|uniref:EGF domain-specific O-linked n=1 Tax=Carex littledalei TaxID=544730 RepID=A0A833R7V3_9POAL|nr:EGF domain-specific O-linked [Carex littledalei]